MLGYQNYSTEVTLSELHCVMLILITLIEVHYINSSISITLEFSHVSLPLHHSNTLRILICQNSDTLEIQIYQIFISSVAICQKF